MHEADGGTAWCVSGLFDNSEVEENEKIVMWYEEGQRGALVRDKIVHGDLSS